ncbi:hypothetical protein C0J52_12267 [Blattella germanica]|nr:hypothetical protein C0J52_12267 [Blattella germanica]
MCKGYQMLDNERQLAWQVYERRMEERQLAWQVYERRMEVILAYSPKPDFEEEKKGERTMPGHRLMEKQCKMINHG